MSGNEVVVGVDGSAGGERALAFGVSLVLAAEVSRLRLVHVGPEYEPGALDAMGLSAEELAHAGSRVLEEAERLVPPELQGTTQVTLMSGGIVDGLLHAAGSASCIVVGLERRSVMERLFTGSTLHGVAARAHVPVYAVPRRWSAGDAGRRVVVAGLKSIDHHHELFDAAFAASQARDARLVVVHAWLQPPAYYALVTDSDSERQWMRVAGRRIRESLVPWRERYPSVETVVRVVSGQPARVLVDAADEAELLVVTRRKHGFPPALHLGGTARAVLRESHSPVEVVVPA